MIVVTGGAGFIGSNLVQALCARARRDVVVVDDLTDGTKFANLVGADIADYIDRDDLFELLRGNDPSVTAVFHQGACATTTEWDGRFMMRNNFEYSKRLLAFCLERGIPFIYASSAATYGNGAAGFREQAACESPLNVYGWSKLVFDNYVRRLLPTARSQIVGLRYFNVYGPREQHKGSMASVAFHLDGQLRESGQVRLFEGTDGYANGAQRRDFVHVDDAVAVNLWFLERPSLSGIFNVGTGRAQPFNDVARAVIDTHGRGELVYVPFPKELAGRYQSFTEADLSRLRGAGCDHTFRDVAAGTRAYVEWLLAGGRR